MGEPDLLISKPVIRKRQNEVVLRRSFLGVVSTWMLWSTHTFSLSVGDFMFSFAMYSDFGVPNQPRIYVMEILECFLCFFLFYQIAQYGKKASKGAR